MATTVKPDTQAQALRGLRTAGVPSGTAGTCLHSRRIIFVLNDLNLGGAERQALLLARELKMSYGADVRVCALEGPNGRVGELCRDYHIPWQHFNIRFAYRRTAIVAAMARLAFELRRLRPDILLPYITRPNILCGCIWPYTRASGCVWNQRDAGLTRFGPRLEQLAVRRTSWFVSNSEHAAEFLRSTLNAPDDRITVIPNGVQVPARPGVECSVPTELQAADEDDFIACMVATISGFKDHATLLRAWRTVVDHWAGKGRPLLILAGKHGDTYERHRELTAKLRLGSQVRFVGEVDDVNTLLRQVDLAVFSSRSEGCPNGVLEAMACGLPIAGTDIAGVREAVGSAGAAYLVPSGDHQGLASRILELAANQALARKLGQDNRNRVSEAFSLELMGQRSAELLIKMLSKESPSSNIS